MEAFLEYIMLNYTWFLGGAIIILLAIIGYYADETNFGQGKDKEEKSDKSSLNENEINSTEIIESKEEQTEPLQIEKKLEEPVQETQMINNQEAVLNQPIDSNEIQSKETNIQETNFDTEFEKFDKEFNEILPQKEIINDELLEEIDNLSFDKTQKINISDIPDLDDVELPKIKSMEPEQQDIWKF